MFKHLLVPLDGSRLAEAALPAAASLSERLDARVTLVHVIERRVLFVDLAVAQFAALGAVVGLLLPAQAALGVAVVDDKTAVVEVTVPSGVPSRSAIAPIFVVTSQPNRRDIPACELPAKQHAAAFRWTRNADAVCWISEHPRSRHAHVQFVRLTAAIPPNSDLHEYAASDLGTCAGPL